MSEKRFPVVQSADDARCFKCDSPLVYHEKSGDAPGSGEFKGKCSKGCEVLTWFDVDPLVQSRADAAEATRLYTLARTGIDSKPERFKAIEWTKRHDRAGWWVVEVTGKDGSYTPIAGPMKQRAAVLEAARRNTTCCADIPDDAGRWTCDLPLDHEGPCRSAE